MHCYGNTIQNLSNTNVCICVNKVFDYILLSATTVVEALEFYTQIKGK